MKLSPKHGLNPTISVCFFCGQDKGEIIISGYLKGDAEAPKRAIANYEPCDECKKQMSRGTLVIEVSTEDNGAPHIQEGAWPTGRWCVIKHTACQHLFGEVHDKVLLEDLVYNKLFRDVVQ